MTLPVQEPVSVELIFNHQKNTTRVERVIWRGRVYKINIHGFRHTSKKGETLFHIFSVASGALYFRLRFDTSSLLWKLEDVYDQTFK